MSAIPVDTTSNPSPPCCISSCSLIAHVCASQPAVTPARVTGWRSNSSFWERLPHLHYLVLTAPTPPVTSAEATNMALSSTDRKGGRCLAFQYVNGAQTSSYFFRRKVLWVICYVVPLILLYLAIYPTYDNFCYTLME